MCICTKTPTCQPKEAATYFQIKISFLQTGFGKFRNLCPGWWVLPGSSETQSVCVCIYHQNMKMILIPLEMFENYMFLFVCDVNNKEFVIHRCSNYLENSSMPESKLCKVLKFYDDRTTGINILAHMREFDMLICRQSSVCKFGNRSV